MIPYPCPLCHDNEHILNCPVCWGFGEYLPPEFLTAWRLGRLEAVCAMAPAVQSRVDAIESDGKIHVFISYDHSPGMTFDEAVKTLSNADVVQNRAFGFLDAKWEGKRIRYDLISSVLYTTLDGARRHDHGGPNVWKPESYVWLDA